MPAGTTVVGSTGKTGGPAGTGTAVAVGTAVGVAVLVGAGAGVGSGSAVGRTVGWTTIPWTTGVGAGAGDWEHAAITDSAIATSTRGTRPPERRGDESFRMVKT